MEFLEITDITNLYQTFICGFILGFSLQVIVLMISGIIHLFKRLTNI